MSKMKKVLIIGGSFFGFILLIAVILTTIAVPDFLEIQEEKREMAREQEVLILLGFIVQSAYATHAEVGRFPSSCEEVGFTGEMLAPGTEFYFRGDKDNFAVSVRAANTKKIYSTDKSRKTKIVEEHIQGPDVFNCTVQ